MMILALFDVFLFIIESLIGYIPKVQALPDWYNSFIALLRTGLYFFPADVFLIAFGNIMYCNFGLIIWSVVEWCYKKIPGVK